jgi:Anthrax toxin LF subunit
MSLFPEYDATAGFPPAHIEAFKRIAKEMKMVISSRELNPCCTDLVLESYAAKGFHIKAKTCDWGPAAGFVVEDYRFIKGSTSFEKQKSSLEAAFHDGAVAMPLFISGERFTALKERGIVKEVSTDGNRTKVTAHSDKENRAYNFVLVKSAGVKGGSATMWGVCYDPSEKPQSTTDRKVSPLALPVAGGLTPVMGMVNPEFADGVKLGVKSAVAGDYDLWCVFPHGSVKDAGINDRPMQLRGAMPKTAGPFVTQQAVRAGVAFDPKTKVELSKKQENPDLGNFSLGIMKVKNALNAACVGVGYSGGNLVQHSDYGGNPFGDIDYPLIFFVPAANLTTVDVMVVGQTDGLTKLKQVLKEIDKRGFVVKLNPAWSVPSF